MNALAEKYKNCCKFCHQKLCDYSISLGTNELSDLSTIESLMGTKLVENCAKYRKIRSNDICITCATQLTGFMNFKTTCTQNEEKFRQEFAAAEQEAMPTRKFVCNFCFKILPSEHQLDEHKTLIHHNEINSNQTFVCSFCFNYFKTENELNVHKTIKHPNQEEPFNDTMDIDLSCGTQPISVKNNDIDDKKVERTELHKCNECNWTFDDKSVFERHCRNLHQKKVPCPFGCLVKLTNEKINNDKRPRKMFRNLFYLANHIQKEHIVKQELP